jgi:D-alanyl-D-alanine dipeptidase
MARLLLTAALALLPFATASPLIGDIERLQMRSSLPSHPHHHAHRDLCPLPTGFVHLSVAVPSIIQEMRYATHHNFVGRPIANYTAPECILTVQAAAALGKVQEFLLSGAADPVSGQAYSLKTYDCYRPTSAVADFVQWALNVSDTLMKAEFYPEVDKSDLFSDGYIAYHSGHSLGSTMDLTMVPLPAGSEPVYHPGVKLESCHAPEGVRWGDNSIDMGTGFDCQ